MASTTPRDERTVGALRLARAAQRKSKKIAEHPELNRSTRQRHSLKVKADALDEVVRVLAGKAA
jgi:hypothetical protein